MAEDPSLVSEVEERVRNLESPEAAVLAVGEEYAAEYAAMDDEYLAARADDVRDVTRQISARLMGRGASAFEALETPSVVLSHNLAPSDTARIQKGMALGFVTAEGRRPRTSRSWPAPWASPPSSASDPPWRRSWAPRRSRSTGERATRSRTPMRRRSLSSRGCLDRWPRKRAALEEYRHIEASTSEGRRIEVAANLGSSSEAEDALRWGRRRRRALPHRVPVHGA